MKDQNSIAIVKTLAHPRILIVEDELMQRQFWRQLIDLEWKDAEIEWASSYAAASVVLNSSDASTRPFDLLISDVFLDGAQTGFQLCKEFFGKLEGRVILVSSFGDVELPTPYDSLLTRERCFGVC